MNPEYFQGPYTPSSFRERIGYNMARAYRGSAAAMVQVLACIGFANITFALSNTPSPLASLTFTAIEPRICRETACR
jgi:hypothetical protein